MIVGAVPLGDDHAVCLTGLEPGFKSKRLRTGDSRITFQGNVIAKLSIELKCTT